MNQSFLLVALLTAGSCVAAVPTWPQFRGPNGSGVAEGDHPPVEFGPGTNLLWKTQVPGGVSSPCIWGDRIFLTGSDDGKPVTLCLNRADGKVLWRQAVEAAPPREIHKKNHPAAATPATDGKNVCVYHATFGLVSYDLAGKELWRKPLPGLLTRNGSGTSPAMLDGRLVLNCDVEDGKSFLAAFDPATGKELWRTPRPEFISGYTTPVRWQHDGRDEVVVSGSLRVVGYDLRSGKQNWSIAGTEAVSVCPTPVLGEGLLYVMSRSMNGSSLPEFAMIAMGVDKDADGKISRDEIPKVFIEQGMFSGIDQNQDGFITDPEWTRAKAFLAQADYGIFALKPPGEGELTTNQIAWKHKKGVASVSSPLFYGGRVYVVQDGGRVTCMEAKGGRKFYEQERLEADGDYFASPVAANGHVYYCSSRGTVTVAKAGDTVQVVARNIIGDPILATPAIADDTIYVRAGNNLFAFGSTPVAKKEP